MNETPEPRKWYKKKRYIIPLGVIGLFTIIGLTADPATNTNNIKSEEQRVNTQEGPPNVILLPNQIEVKESVVQEARSVDAKPVVPPMAPTEKPVSAQEGTVPPQSMPKPNPVVTGGDKDCKDFSTQAEAQAYFNAGGGSPSNNFDGLDRDHDGVACESLH